MARLSIYLACFVVFLGSVSSAVAGPLGNAAKAGRRSYLHIKRDGFLFLVAAFSAASL